MANHLNGSTRASNGVSSSPANDIAKARTVHVRNVSRSVNPLSLLITQNPLSFIHEFREVHPDVQLIIALHDEATRAESKLALA